MTYLQTSHAAGTYFDPRTKVSIASPLLRPSPNGRRVGIRADTFEAFLGFTHVPPSLPNWFRSTHLTSASPGWRSRALAAWPEGVGAAGPKTGRLRRSSSFETTPRP